jgi:hypothetical protein
MVSALDSGSHSRGDVDFLVIRENSEGEYSSIGGKIFEGTESDLKVHFGQAHWCPSLTAACGITPKARSSDPNLPSAAVFLTVQTAARVCVSWPRTMRLVGRVWHFTCIASSGMDMQMYDYVVVGGGSAGESRFSLTPVCGMEEFHWECR